MTLIAIAAAGACLAAALRLTGGRQLAVGAAAALAVVAVGAVSLDQARGALTGLVEVVGYLVAILLLATLAERGGVFDRLGYAVAHHCTARPARLGLWVLGTGATVTVLLTLDATVVLLAPVLLLAAGRLRVPTWPVDLATARIANSASILLPVSNLTNLIAFSASGLSFLHFTALMAPAWVLLVVAEYAAYRTLARAEARRAGPDRDRPHPEETRAYATRRTSFLSRGHTRDKSRVATARFAGVERAGVERRGVERRGGEPDGAAPGGAAHRDTPRRRPRRRWRGGVRALMPRRSSPAAALPEAPLPPELVSPEVPLPPEPSAAPTADRTVLVVLAVTLVSLVVGAEAGLDPVWPALCGAAGLGVRELLRRRMSAGDLVRAAHLPFAAFVLCWSVAVAALAEVGGARLLSAALPASAGVGALVVIALIATLAANLVNNLPATLLLVPLVAPLGAVAVLAVLIGVGVGAGATYAGSLANLLWLRNPALTHPPDVAARFHRVGLALTPVLVVLATLTLAGTARVLGP